MVENEIIAGVPDRYLDAIAYNKNIKWEEEGKEFRINDDFYDVVRIKKVNGKIIFYCLNDKSEELLVKNFAKTIKLATDNERGKNNKHYFQFQLMDDYKDLFTSLIYFKCIVKYVYFNYQSSLVSNNKEIIIPPPWLS